MAKNARERKVKISSQMQVRIPIDWYEDYGFGKEALCVATETGIEFRPIKNAAEQCGDLLEELIAQGLSGDELVARFREQASTKTAKIDYSGNAGD